MKRSLDKGQGCSLGTGLAGRERGLTQTHGELGGHGQAWC